MDIFPYSSHLFAWDCIGILKKNYVLVFPGLTLNCPLGEINLSHWDVKKWDPSLVGDHFLYSHDLNVWFEGDIERRI